MSASHAHHEIAKTRNAILRDRAYAFCNAFLDLSSNPPEKLLSEHFVAATPRITEHGPEWAKERLPFLGKTFSGKQECLEYFSLLAETLEFIPSKKTFPGKDGILVDERATVADGKKQQGGLKGVVSVVGHAEFKAVKTGESWQESFIWRLSGFDEDGKIGHWEIWADPLSAWSAVGGGK